MLDWNAYRDELKSRIGEIGKLVAERAIEKGVTDVEIVQIDIMSGEHRTADYRAKFGVPHVPALELWYTGYSAASGSGTMGET